jgi:hypothetical protein
MHHAASIKLAMSRTFQVKAKSEVEAHCDLAAEPQPSVQPHWLLLLHLDVLV